MILLNFLLISIISYVATKGYSIAFSLKIVKDLMNKGYKFDTKNMKDVIENMPEDMQKMSKIENYIPLWNFVKMILVSYKFANNKEAIYDRLADMNIIVKMEDFNQNDASFDKFIKAASKDPAKASETLKAKAELKKTIDDMKERKNNIKNNKKKIKVLKEIGSLLEDYKNEVNELRDIVYDSSNKYIHYVPKLLLVLDEALEITGIFKVEDDITLLNSKKEYLITKLNEIKILKKQIKNNSYVISDEERKKVIDSALDYVLNQFAKPVEENKDSYTDDVNNALLEENIDEVPTKK